MFVRVCEGLNDIGKLVPSNEFYKYIKDQNKDHYISIYNYTESHKKKAEALIEVQRDGKSIQRPRGVSGITDVTTNKLVWDFDSNELEEARQDTIQLVNKLVSSGIKEEDINICFSGNKGFAVELNTTDTFTPEEFKNIVTQLASDLKTFDPKIVNPSRIFRLPFTKHLTSGLYKTPLYKNELESLTIDEIKDIAKTPINIDVDYLTYKSTLPLKVKLLKDKAKKEQKTVSAPEDLDFANKPSWLSNWKYALSRGLFKEGTRSFALTILAATCRSQGMSQKQTYYFLKAAADEQSERYGTEKFNKNEIWKNIIEIVYGPNWNGGSWSEDHFPEDLKQFLVDLGIPRGDELPEVELIETVDKGFNDFISYAKDIEKNTVKFGIKSIDQNLKIRKGHLLGLIAPPGVGKCHGKGTKILMYDGSIKLVEDVVVGDLLMGDDSTPRKVLSLARGQEMLYNVKQENGEDYVINESHILTLKGSSTDEKKQYPYSKIEDIPLTAYLKKGVDYRKRMKGFKVPVNFSKKYLEVDPYILGVWLGDGTTSKPEFTISKKDSVILDKIMYWGDKNNLKVNVYNYESSSKEVNTITVTGGSDNTFRQFLNNKNLFKGKYIPKEYLTSDRNDRLNLLAGLLDTDGHLTNGNAFEISGKCENLMNQIVFLARSLGYRSTLIKEKKHYKSFTKGKLYEGYSDICRVFIMGDNLHEIPTLVPRKQAVSKERRTYQDLTRISIEQIGIGDYYGFTLDGNHRYLLGDFTVTHNTSFAVTLANNMSKEGSLVYFASYDMYRHNVYQKLIQRHTGYSDEKIYSAFINNDAELIAEFRKILEDNYKNVTFCFKSGQSIAQLKKSLKNLEEQQGRKVDLVVVDYIELILTDKSDPTSASAEAAQGLREIANEGKVVLCLLQPNKMNSKPNKPLTSYNSAKGSSAIAQSVTAMLTLHRPGLHSRLKGEDNFIGLDCVKNRNGGLFSLDFYWDGKTQTFSELDDVGKVRLDQVRQMIRDLENEDTEEF